jgi:hypothetical protein
MSDMEELRSSIDSLLNEIRTTIDTIESDFSRFQVSLAGTLRLLDDSNTKTLTALKGNPEDLKSYLITLVSELQQKTLNNLRKLSQNTTQILKMIDKDDRKH